MSRANVSLAGRVVVITGAARGVGEATAQRLARAGVQVALADLDAARAETLARELPGAHAFEVDVADRQAFASCCHEVERRMGAPDVLVNNAAVMALAPFLDTPEEVLRRQLEVNVMGVVHGMQLGLPRMVERGRGHVVNVSSSAGKWGVPGENAYCAGKHAVVGLTELVRRELRGSGVDLSLVFFGRRT